MKENNSLKRKAQLFSVDVGLTFLVFVGFIVIFTTLWNQSVKQLDESLEKQNLQEKIFYYSDYLVRTKGYPENWNNSNVLLIGFAGNNENVLLTSKIDNFMLLNYSFAKNRMNLEGNEFYLKIIDVIHNQTLYSYGNMSYQDSKELIQITRFCLVNNTSKLIPSKLVLGVWKN